MQYARRGGTSGPMARIRMRWIGTQVVRRENMLESVELEMVHGLDRTVIRWSAHAMQYLGGSVFVYLH